MALPDFDDPNCCTHWMPLEGYDYFGAFDFGGTLDWHGADAGVWDRYNLLTDPQLCAWLEWSGPRFGDAMPELGVLLPAPCYLNRAPRYYAKQ